MSDVGCGISDVRPASAHAGPGATEPTDADLVVAARQGDRAAFSSIYARHARVVHGVLLARVGRADADDLVQEVFIKAWRSMGSIRDGASLGAWLCKVARRSASDLRRSSLRGRLMLRRIAEREPSTDGGAGEAGEESGRASPDSAKAQAILDAIRNLPEAYRETLILRLVEGMTGPEIARATGLTEGSVRVNLCRGMKQLREQLTMMEGRP